MSLSRAVDLLGGPTATSRVLRVTPQAVFFWLKGERQLPPDKAIDLERETAGQVTVEELRPDIDWQVIRGHPAKFSERAA
jgi:DNA-binding transcriptional regulator YdaS (Cro superfamily)